MADFYKKPMDDQLVYAKLARGEALTPFQLDLILDSSSVENVVKQKYDNLKMNMELEEHFENEREKRQELLESMLRGMTEYLLWKYSQDEKTYEQQNAIIQQQIANEFNTEEKYALLDKNSDEKWIKDFLKAMLPDPELSLEEIFNHISIEADKRTDPTVDARSVKLVLLLASKSPTLREYIFPHEHPAESHAHCQFVANRILDVGAALKCIECHKFMSTPKLIDEIQLFLSDCKKESPTPRAHR